MTLETGASLDLLYYVRQSAFQPITWRSMRLVYFSETWLFWFKHILFDQSLIHKYNIIEVGSDSKP